MRYLPKKFRRLCWRRFSVVSEFLIPLLHRLSRIIRLNEALSIGSEVFTTEFGQRDRVDGMARDRIFYAPARNGIRIPVSTHLVRMTQLPAHVEEPQGNIVSERAMRLRSAGVLGMLSLEQLEKIAGKHDERMYAVGERMIRQGDSGASMFFITDGEVVVSVNEPGKNQIQLRTLQSGDYFGEMSLMAGEPRLATVTATAETRVLRLQEIHFERYWSISLAY